MTLGGRCTNADFKGYRADVAARVGGSVRLDKGQGNFWGFTVFGGQDRVTIFQRSTVFLVGNSRDGQSRPALRQCSYFLTFLRHSSTNRTAEHSASTNKSAGRAASPVCGIRNVGAMVCAGAWRAAFHRQAFARLPARELCWPAAGSTDRCPQAAAQRAKAKAREASFFMGDFSYSI